MGWVGPRRLPCSSALKLQKQRGTKSTRPTVLVRGACHCPGKFKRLHCKSSLPEKSKIDCKRKRDRRLQKARVNARIAFSRWIELMQEKDFKRDAEVNVTVLIISFFFIVWLCTLGTLDTYITSCKKGHNMVSFKI